MTRSLKNTTFAEPRPEALMDNFMAAAPPPYHLCKQFIYKQWYCIILSLSEPRLVRIRGFTGLCNSRCYPVNPKIRGIKVQTFRIFTFTLQNGGTL